MTACGGSPAPLVDAPQANGTQDSSSAVDAPVASGTDPAGDGTYAVTSSTSSIPAGTNRNVAATVFVPSGTTGDRPLVVISPGFQMQRTQYTSYARHLATWGFVVVLTDYADSGFFASHQDMADDVTTIIDWALAQSSLAVDAQRIATAGHSLGGKISVFAASQDARIRAVVAWDPVDGSNPSVVPEKMTSLSIPIAVVGETTNGSGGGMPCAPSAENFERFYAAAASPSLSITVLGADHMDWVDDPSCTFCGFCSPGTASADLARTVTRRLDVAWLRRYLLDDTTMEPWLTTPPELASSAITIARR